MDKQTALRRTAEFFKLNPDGFTQHALARDSRGNSVEPSSPRACQWCGVGRIAKEIGVPTGADAYARVKAFLGMETSTIVATNDGEGREPLVQTLDELTRNVA